MRSSTSAATDRSELSAVIDQMAKLLGKKPQIERRPAHPADVLATWANITKAGQLLDWTPQVPIEEGLGHAVAWYRGNREQVIQLEMRDREI